MINQNDCCTERKACPTVLNIEKATLENKKFRTVLLTGEHLQITLMCIKPNCETGVEIHNDTDQFLKIVCGNGVFLTGDCNNNLNKMCKIEEGSGVFIPAGTWHNIINTGRCPMKIYSIYAPPHHSDTDSCDCNSNNC